MKDARGYGTGLKYNLPLDEIVRLYLQEKLPMKAIAKRYDVSRIVIVKRLKIAGVSRRTRSQVHKLAYERMAPRWCAKFRSRVYPEKQCSQCGATFIDETKNYNKLYCSSTCQLAHWRSIKGKQYFVDVNRRYATKKASRVREQKQAMRREVVLHLSDEIKCKRCGYTDFRALQIDHINAGGNRERDERKGKGGGGLGSQNRFWKLILSLPRDVARAKYQVLCANCNCIKRTENKEHYGGKKKALG